MTAPACPECQASLDQHALSASGKKNCPFCGTDVAHLALLDSADESSPPESSTDIDATPRPGEPFDLSRRPAKCLIDVVESTADRTLVFIPSGGRTAWSMAVFAVIWNVFSWGVAITFFVAADELFPLLFMSIFVLVGMFLAWITIKMMFTRTFLLLTPDNVAIQKVMFGMRRVKQHPLGPDSYATLTEAYSQNDVPVYRVDIIGEASTAKIGTRLPEPDKQWLAESVNRFLGKDIDTTPWSPKPLVEQLVLSDTPVELLSPTQLPAGSVVTVESDSVDELRFSYVAVPASKGRNIAVAVPAMIATILFIVFVAPAIQDGLNKADLVVMLFGLCFSAVPFLMASALALTILFGRVTVSVNQTDLTARLRFGLIRKSKTVSNDEIEAILLGHTNVKRKPSTVRKERVNMTGTVHTCTLRTTTGGVFPVALFQTAETNQQIAGMIRHRLSAFGIYPKDA